MKIDVGENIVEPIIRDQIAAAVAAHLGDPEDIVQRLVSVALKTKTNENGVVSQNRYDNKHDFLEALASKAIREAARSALEKIVEEQKPQIQRAVEDELRKRPKKTAAAIMSAFCDTDTIRYRTNVTFEFSERT